MTASEATCILDCLWQTELVCSYTVRAVFLQSSLMNIVQPLENQELKWDR